MNQTGEVWTVYVLRSLSKGWLYIGMTNDLERRLREHNRGYNRSTKGKGPFELVHTETFATRVEARAREKHLKTGADKNNCAGSSRQKTAARGNASEDVNLSPKRPKRASSAAQVKDLQAILGRRVHLFTGSEALRHGRPRQAG